jgi:hypothetical protein
LLHRILNPVRAHHSEIPLHVEREFVADDAGDADNRDTVVDGDVDRRVFFRELQHVVHGMTGAGLVKHRGE